MLDTFAYFVNEWLYQAMPPVLMALLLGSICEKKRGSAGLIALGLVLTVLISAFRCYSALTGLFTSELWQSGIPGFVSTYIWQLYLAAVFLYVKLCFDCGWLTALFCFLTGYCAHELYVGIRVYIGISAYAALTAMLLETALAVAIAVAVVRLFRRKMSQKTILALQRRHKAAILLLFVLVVALTHISVQVVLSVHRFIPLIPEGTQLLADGLRYLDQASSASILANIIGDLIILFALYHMLAYTETDLNEELFSTMYRQEWARYEQFKQNMDYINAKYHDLKHILSLIKNDRDGAGRMLEDVTENVAFLQSEIDTGDEALDNVLTDRYMLCRQKGIELHLMTDGTTFEWVDTVDLYLIFCNMLDNAIEYLDTVEQEKIITIGIRTIRHMVLIHQENGLYEALRMEGSIPASAKGEARDHGFGIKSIAATVERYGGSMTVNAEGGKFSLDILFQKP